MSLIEPVIRPPSEADSFLLQVTLGCSSNSCTFCGAYTGKDFRVKPQAEIFSDITEWADYAPDTRRVFLCDGDALVLSNEKLLPILVKLQDSFPKLTKISSYANAQNILAKTPEELKKLADNKLKLLFLGLESGSNKVLTAVKKKASAEEMVAAVQKAQDAGLKIHVIALLGLGGRSGSMEHALETAKVINQMQPRYLSLLSLMLVPGTELYADKEFEQLDPQELLQETKLIIENLELQNTIFRSDHASNYIPLEGSLPKDKTKLLELLKSGISGKQQLRPEFLRGL